jgi:hypothetical protein
MDETPDGSPPESILKRIRSRRTRRIVSNILLALSCLIAPIAAASVWARNEVPDTDRYVETVDELAADPVIQEAAATRVTDAIFSRIDLGS